MITTYNLNNSIKEKFKLYTGLRDEREDNKILKRVTELSFYEAASFLEENINSISSNIALEQAKKGNYKEAFEELLSNLKSDKELSFRLTKRLEYFLNNLVYQTINNKHV
jgi:hypothetical protein